MSRILCRGKGVRGVCKALLAVCDAGVNDIEIRHRSDDYQLPQFLNFSARCPDLTGLRFTIRDGEAGFRLGVDLMLDQPGLAARLERLHVRVRMVQEDLLVALEKAVAPCVLLTHAKVSSRRRSVVGRTLAALGGGITQMQNLTTLCLEESDLTNSGPLLSAALQRMPALLSLDVEGAVMDDAAAQAIAAHASPALLNLRMTLASGRREVPLVNAFAPRLTDLNLRYKVLRPDMVSFAGPDFGSFSALKTLDLHATPMFPGIECPIALLEGIGLLTGLTSLTLRLQGSDIGNVAPAVRPLTHLMTLVLGDMHATEDGCRALATALGGVTTLRALHFSDCDLTPNCFDVFGPAIQGLTGLTDLEVSGNGRLGANGAYVLAQALPPSLTILDVRNNNIGPAGLLALAPRLAALPRLRQLDLTSNDLGLHQGIATVLDTIPRLTELEELDLFSYNNFGDLEQQRIRQELRRTNQKLVICDDRRFD